MTSERQNIEIDDILAQLAEGKRLTPESAVLLLKSNELAKLGGAADRRACELHPEPYRTYNIDRNINYTNVCVSGCRFCAFSCEPGSDRGYVLTLDDLYRKIDETIELGGNQILMQGGLNPELPLDWYIELLTSIKQRYPSLNIHGFSPTEIHFLAEQNRLPVRDVLLQLRDAGLGSIPGGGAEILVDRVREQISPNKATADQWLEVCRQWHQLGGRGTATMMFGHVETLRDRVEHLDRIRRLQDETGGFTAFIAWTFQPGRTQLAHLPKCGVWEYLKMLAVARLYLDNVPNLQVSWVTQGLDVGQLALRLGGNDMGSLMIEENVVAATGVRFQYTEEQLRRAIQRMGYEPRRRDVFYRVVEGGEIC